MSGSVPVFDPLMFRSLTWASQHYVAPLAVVLGKTAPPNLPRKLPKGPDSAIPDPEGIHPLAAVAEASGRGARVPTTAIVGRWQGLEWLGELGSALAAERNVMVVTATAAEASEIAEAATPRFGDRVVVVASDHDAELTRAWELAQTPGRLIVGSPRLAVWKIASLAVAVVLEEGRRAMKERQTPTIHVREILRTRSLVEGFNLVFLGPTPSVELLAAGARIERFGRRPWGLVEVVDRSTDSGGGLISDQVMAALRAVLSADSETAFVLTGHKMAPKIVDEINRRLGKGAAAVSPEPAIIGVGTERDLAGLDPVSVAVAANVDFMVAGTNYRSGEEAFRQLARLGNTLRTGRGRRMMIQTTAPDSMLVEALRRGEPMPYLEQVLVERARTGMPPSAEMLAVEIRGIQPDDADATIRQLSGVDILGPLAIEEGRRWLLTGDLKAARRQLRPLVGRWRESDAIIRIDADPIDL